MALSNSQYDHLMRTYEQKQLDNEFQLRKRYEKAYALIPELEEVDHSISSLSVKKARLLLDGDQTALSSLKSEIKELSARKPALLKAHGLPATVSKKRLWIIYIRNLISKISLTKRTFQPVLCPIIPGIISIRLPDVLLWNQWKLH